MSGQFPRDDEIRAELDEARADIERTRADIERTRAQLAETVEALSLEMPVTGQRTHGAGPTRVAGPQFVKEPMSEPRPVTEIAQVAEPVAGRRSGGLKRAALFAVGLLWLVGALRRRRHQR